MMWTFFNMNASVCVQNLHAEGLRRYNSAVGRINQLTKECEDYRDAADEMDKEVESIPDVITKLE